MSYTENEPSVPETTVAQTTEAPEATTISLPSTTARSILRSTTTTTSAPSSLSTRRLILRRRGPTSTASSTTSAPSSTQVSVRNYAFRRRRPLASSNEIFLDSESIDLVSRKIRSTTPDSLEVDRVNKDGESDVREFRGRLQTSQTTQNEDSVPAEASFLSRGDFRPEVNADEGISLIPEDNTSQFELPRDLSSIPNIYPRQRTTAPNAVDDSEVSAATVDVKRTNILPRGKSRFTLNLTTEPSVQAPVLGSVGQRRPTFARFTPRPFTRTTDASILDDENLNNNDQKKRNPSRLPFGRTRPTLSTNRPVIQGRRLPFPSRFSTTQQTTISKNEEFEIENKNDDIYLSESAIEEKEHKDNYEEIEITTKPFETISSSVSDDLTAYDTESLNNNENKRFRIFRKRPSSTTSPGDIEEKSESTTTTIQRIRKIIRKKIKPVDDFPEIIAKSIGSFNSLKETTTVTLPNYGEKTRSTGSVSVSTIPTTTITPITTTPITTTIVTTTMTEQITEKVSDSTEALDVSTDSDFETPEENLEKSQDKLISSFETPLITQEGPKGTIDTIIDSQDITTKTPEVTTKGPEETKEIEKSEGVTVESEIEMNNTIAEMHDETHSEETTTAVPNSDILINITTENVPLNGTENNFTIFNITSTTETSEAKIETTTKSTTLLTSPSARTRVPYKPSKRLFTSTTVSSVPSSSRVFSRKYNPGVYTSPKTVEREPFKPSASVTKRLFPSKIFTRKPYTITKTTPKAFYEDEEYYEDEELLEEEPENPFVFVPPNQLFTKKPDYVDETEDETFNEEPEELLEEEEEVYDEELPETKITSTTRKLPFKPRIINANTFRSTTSTTDLPRRFINSQSSSVNKTGGFPRFTGNKPVNGTKKRVQNVPPGYNSPVSAPRPKTTFTTKNYNQTLSTESIKEIITTTSRSTEPETTTVTESDYLMNTETISTIQDNVKSSDITTTNTEEVETTTVLTEDNVKIDDYLANSESITSVPTTTEIKINLQISTTFEPTVAPTTSITIKTEENTDNPTEPILTTTTAATTTTSTTTTPTTRTTPAPPIIKTQFDKLFSVSRVIEVSSKLDKHRLNKNNETTLIEEGPIKVEKKPVLDKIGEVSRFSLIKIVEDEIPIYLTKFGHIYPVDNPPDNPIRIDEARNARALNYLDIPKENLVTSESINEAYRHVKRTSEGNGVIKSEIEHLPHDGFLSYVNDEKPDNIVQHDPLFEQWQFVPAAYENEKSKQTKAEKQLEIITPRSMLTNPSTLPIEGLFKTENPIKARKVNDANQPFVVYSAPIASQSAPEIEEAKIVQLKILKPETGRSIVTFVKGQEMSGAPNLEEPMIKYPVNITVLPSTPEPITTTSTTTTSTTEAPSTSPIIALLSTKATTQSTTAVPDTTTVSTTEATTEKVTEEPHTTKLLPLNAKRAKYAFPRRPLIKPSNITRTTSTSRPPKKTNVSISANIVKKANKTSSFNPTKSRLTGIRVQNVPVDIKKKIGNIKTTTKSYTTTESPKSTTERKLYFKSLRSGFQRPTFVPRKNTPPTNTGDT